MFLRNECSTRNPIFAVYCADSGGELSLEETVDGLGEYEVCILNGVQCSDFDYYELNKCPFTSTSSYDSLCVARGGTSRPMGTRRTASSVDGSEYFLCYFGSDNACEMGKLMSGDCDENTPNLISFCADNGGMMSLGGVEPHEYEVCTLADGIKCIEEHYYLHDNCTTTKEVDPTEIPPDNDSCSSATVISSIPFEQEGTAAGATADIWATDPSCNFQQVSIGNGVWYNIIENLHADSWIACY
jgi:putative hemolysin